MKRENKVTCSDAVQAFLQSFLDQGDFMLVIIRKELWLSSWSRKFGEHAVLAVRLRKSLYGHPKAGRWWQDHLTTCLIALGGIEMQEHASNFVFRWTGDDGKFHVIPLNVYLDDLTLSGHHSCHASFGKHCQRKSS